jgi:hypothetical protein
MIEPNIWDAFHEAGFEFETRTELYRLVFHEEKLRKTPGLQEIWSLDFPREKLSRRRHAAKFGWIKQVESTWMMDINRNSTERVSRSRDNSKSQNGNDPRELSTNFIPFL